ALALSPDGAVLASADTEELIYLFDFSVGKLRGRLEGHKGSISCLSFSRDNQKLASGGSDRVVRIWDPQRIQTSSRARSAPVAPARGVSECGISMALNADGRRLACANG